MVGASLSLSSVSFPILVEFSLSVVLSFSNGFGFSGSLGFFPSFSVTFVDSFLSCVSSFGLHAVTPRTSRIVNKRNIFFIHAHLAFYLHNNRFYTKDGVDISSL